MSDIPAPLLAQDAHEFDGRIAAAVIIAHEASYLLSEGTFALTFTADSVSGRRALFSKDSYGFDDGGHVTAYIENGDLLVRFQSTNQSYTLNVPDTVSAGQSYHMALTFGAAGLKLYVDGTLAAQNSYTGGLLGNQEPLVLGANSWASDDLAASPLRDPFDGEIAEFALYGQALSAADIATLADKPVPLAVADEAATAEDQPVSIAVLDNDSDPAGGIVSLGSVEQPTHGTTAVDDNGTPNDAGDDRVIYTPDPDFFGIDSFTYNVRNSAGGSATGTVTITVAAEPDAPVARDDSYAVLPGQSLSVGAAAGVLANDSDADGDGLRATLISGPSQGTLTLNADGSFSYTPEAGFAGSDSFTYAADDNTGRSDSATVTFSGRSGSTAAPRIVTGTSAFERHIVDSSMALTHVAYAADLDGDGDIDLMSTSEGTDQVAWFENDGALNFSKRVIDANLESAYPASLADLDQDGDIDVLAGGYREDLYVWYENDGGGGFTRRVIDSQNGPHSIFAVDMDADGDLDLLTATQDANRIAWYENDGNQGFTERLIDNQARGAKTAVAADIDADGDLDVVAASNQIDTIAWYENNGVGGFTRRVIDTSADGAYYAIAADLNNDGHLDIVTASQNDDKIAWLRNDGAGGFTKFVIDGSADGARSVHAADVDGDGDIDVLAASVNDSTLAWHENLGGGSFASHVVDHVAGAYGVGAFDVDRDGQLDVLSAGRDDGSVSFHRQVKAHGLQLDAGGTLTIGTAALQAVDADDGPAALTYTLATAPNAGMLLLDEAALTAGGTFSQSDVDLGRIAYRHTQGGAAIDSFRLDLADASGGSLAPATATFAVSITPAGGGGGEPLLASGPHVFTGSTSSAVVVQHQSSYLLEQGTVEMIFAADTVSGRSALFSKDSYGYDNGGHLTILVENGNLLARIQSTSQTYEVRGDNAVSAGQQHHMAFTFGPGGLKLYLDGNLLDDDPYTGGLTGNQEPLVLGANSWASDDLQATPLRDPFDGDIAVMRLYGEALSGDDIWV